MNVPQYPAGLYLEGFGDDCRLVLPYGIGAYGFARKSDGARFGENTEDKGVVQAKNTFADLYQPGYHPFIEGWSVSLASVLKSWLERVESGDWKVNKDGIMDGINEWKKADTSSGWGKYVIPFV